MPILGGNEVEFLVDYDGTIARLVTDIDRADNHVHLLFYIFADDGATAPVIDALGRAAKRGVRCRVLAYYEELLEAGVQIHLYRKNFLHAKHLSIDDSVALIGTSNLDIRSFVLNAELMLMICNPGLVARLAAEQERYFANCRLLTLTAWRARSFGRKFVQNLARLLSPLL